MHFSALHNVALWHFGTGTNALNLWPVLGVLRA
jgi:hypothetical protein